MRKETFAEDYYYHIYNRGVEKRIIFLDDEDRWRFITLLILYQGTTYVPQVSRVISNVKHLVFDKAPFDQLLKSQTIEVVSFCLMPNHFHLILQEKSGGGISNFMQRLGNGYTKYFNAKYHRAGHLFGGVFQAIHIDTDEYLQYLSAYIHLNPRELFRWRGKEDEYPWSSFQDYTGKNRWQNFLNPSVVLDGFQDQKEYKKFVVHSNIKNNIEDRYLLD